MSEVAQSPVAPAAPATAPVEPAAPAEGEELPAQKPAETAPATAPDSEKKPDTPDQAEKRGHSRFERKISRLHREAAEWRARAELLERENATLKPKPSDTGAPKLEQFDDIEKYAEAREKYAKQQAEKEFQEKHRTETQKQAQARIVEDWEAKTAKVDAKYEDFDEVVGDLKPTMPWSMAVMKAANGDDVAYHLGKNEAEARRIMSLDPIDQILEIGRLAAKLAAEPPKPKTPSRAPAPITPLTGAATTVTDTPSEQDDIGAWIKKRQKEVHAKRR